jgi:preprotein translocase subunit SecG
MTILITIVHIIVSLFLIAVVLLQSGKGAEMGAAFGGSSQTLFGSRGAATFLSKMTTFAAIGFMLTSLLLAVVTSKGGSVVRRVPVTQGQKAMPIPSGGPVQGTGSQPLQPKQQAPQKPLQQAPQTQKAPQIPQQTPAK